MRKPEWLFVGGLVLVSAYFIFRYATEKETFNPRDLIPKNTVAVYETENIGEVWNTIAESEQWQTLKTVPTVAALSEDFVELDSLMGAKGSFINSMGRKPLMVSMHITSIESTGFLYYLPLNRAGRNNFQRAANELVSKKGYKPKIRTYLDMEIQGLAKEDLLIEYVLYEDYLIIGSVGFLIEDVVRNVVDDFSNNFLKTYPDMFNDPSLSSDQGNIYINGTQWQPLLRTIRDNSGIPVLTLAESMFFDASLSGDDLLLSGFLYTGDNQGMISTFIGQEPVSLHLLRLVPNLTAELIHFGLSDLQLWYPQWKKLNSKVVSQYAQPMVSPEDIMKNAKEEVAIATLETIDPSISKKLLFIGVKDEAGMRNELSRIAETLASAKDDTVYFEEYADYKLGLLEIPELPASLLGEQFTGFPSSHYLFYNDYLVLASSDVTLKEWLESIDDEDTWGQTVEVNTFLKENLGDANYTHVLSLSHSWNRMMEALLPKRVSWFENNAQVLKQFDLLGLQFSNLDNRFYANLNWNFRERKLQKPVSDALEDEMLVHFNAPIITKPKVVRNHNTGAFEIIVQDSTNMVHLIDGRGEELWADSVAGPIVTEIFQIDYYANNKLQYLFATADRLYVIDRNGDSVENFPLSFKEFGIRDLYLIDYDRSKRYRFLLGNDRGDLLMLNKAGKQLDGWNPKSLNSNLTEDVRHVRVRGNDRIIIPQENGSILVTNRRGETVEGFPFDAGFNLYNPIFFTPGSSFGNSTFILLSEDGLVSGFDLNGNPLAKNQLSKPNSSASFKLVIERTGRDYVFARKDVNRLALLNKQGALMFEKDYGNTESKEIQYYNFGPDRELYIVIDRFSNTLYLYNRAGDLINSPETQADFPVSVVYRRSTGKCYIYFAHDHSMMIKSFVLE